MNESIERLLEARGVLVDPGDKRTPREIYEALFGSIMTAEAPIYDPGTLSVEQKINC